MNDTQANQRPSGDTQRARGSTVSATACDQCYRCKVRCSGPRDNCDRCLQSGNICTYSLGKPLGKPPKNGRGKNPKSKPQTTKRLRCPSEDAQADADGFDQPESPSPSSSASGRKRRRLDSEAQKVLDTTLSNTRPEDKDTGSTSMGALFQQAFHGEAGGETALLGLDMDMPMDLHMDLDLNFDSSNFGFYMDSPRIGTPAVGRHVTPTPIVTTGPVVDLNADAGTSLITPPASLSSAVEATSSSPELFTPDFMRLVSDLYTAPHSTFQRFDRTLHLARQGLDAVISCLRDLDSPIGQSSVSPSSPLACVIIVQQVVASYTDLRSQISSRPDPSDSPSKDSNSGIKASTNLSSTLKGVNEDSEESVYIGDFEVQGTESQSHVLRAIVDVEVERLRKVWRRLEEWAKELDKNGKGEGKLVELILATLNARLGTSGE